MKKFNHLQCTICRKVKTELIDIKYFLPDKCTLTTNCLGKLVVTRRTNTKVISAANLTTDKTVEQTIDTIKLTAGDKQTLTVAIPKSLLGYVPAGVSNFSLILDIETVDPRNYKSYVYKKSSAITFLSGTEDNSNKKVLTYTASGLTPDIILVYINGTLLADTEYYIYVDNTSSTPPNSITFITAVSAYSSIEVVVSKAQTTSTVTFPFTKLIVDESRKFATAWEDVKLASTIDDDFYLYYCDFSEISSTVKLNTNLWISATSFTFYDSVNGNRTITTDKAFFVLTQPFAFTPIDRVLSSVVKLSSINSATNSIVSILNKEIPILITNASNATGIFPPLKITRFAGFTIQDFNGTIDTETESILFNNQNILGPEL